MAPITGPDVVAAALKAVLEAVPPERPTKYGIVDPQGDTFHVKCPDYMLNRSVRNAEIAAMKEHPSKSGKLHLNPDVFNADGSLINGKLPGLCADTFKELLVQSVPEPPCRLFHQHPPRPDSTHQERLSDVLDEIHYETQQDPDGSEGEDLGDDTNNEDTDEESASDEVNLELFWKPKPGQSISLETDMSHKFKVATNAPLREAFNAFQRKVGKPKSEFSWIYNKINYSPEDTWESIKRIDGDDMPVLVAELVRDGDKDVVRKKQPSKSTENEAAEPKQAKTTQPPTPSEKEAAASLRDFAQAACQKIAKNGEEIVIVLRWHKGSAFDHEIRMPIKKTTKLGCAFLKFREMNDLPEDGPELHWSFNHQSVWNGSTLECVHVSTNNEDDPPIFYAKLPDMAVNVFWHPVTRDQAVAITAKDGAVQEQLTLAMDSPLGPTLSTFVQRHLEDYKEGDESDDNWSWFHDGAQIDSSSSPHAMGWKLDKVPPRIIGKYHQSSSPVDEEEASSEKEDPPTAEGSTDKARGSPRRKCPTAAASTGASSTPTAAASTEALAGDDDAVDPAVERGNKPPPADDAKDDKDDDASVDIEKLIAHCPANEPELLAMLIREREEADQNRERRATFSTAETFDGRVSPQPSTASSEASATSSEAAGDTTEEEDLPDDDSSYDIDEDDVSNDRKCRSKKEARTPAGMEVEVPTADAAVVEAPAPAVAASVVDPPVAAPVVDPTVAAPVVDPSEAAPVDPSEADAPVEAVAEPQRLTEAYPNAPSFIEEDDNNEIVIKLDNMAVETRVKVELVMHMCRDPDTHFQKITNPIDLIADLLNEPKLSIAFVLTPEDIARWDWATKPLPKVPATIHDQSRVMCGVYSAVVNKHETMGIKGKMGQLKGWKHYRRLWRQGRQLYSDYQHLMPGSTNQEIEDTMVKELSRFRKKPQMQDFMSKKLRDFKEKMMTEQRAKRNLEEAAAGATRGETTGVCGARGGRKTMAFATATTATGGVDDGRTAEPAVPIDDPAVGTPSSSRSRAAPDATTTTATGGADDGRTAEPAVSIDDPAVGKRSSSRSRAAPNVYDPSDGKSAAAPKRKRRTVDFTGTTKKPKLAEAAIAEGARKSRGRHGCTAPSKEWVAEAMYKLAMLKHLCNCCKLAGMVAPRAFMSEFIDDLMGGGAAYDRPFLILLSTALANNMEETDEALWSILRSLKSARLLTPEAISLCTAANLKTLLEPHDESLKPDWIINMCEALVKKNDGLVPRTIEGLLDLKIKEITFSVAVAVSQDAFGWFYGPAVDQYYGTRMAIALDLIAESHCDKSKIDADCVRASLMKWLPVEEWKGFHSLMVSAAQLITESTDTDGAKNVEKVVKDEFPKKSKDLVLGMVESIVNTFFGAVEEDDEE